MLLHIQRDEAANVIVVETEEDGERVLFGVEFLRDLCADPYTPPARFDQFLRDHIQRTLGVNATARDIRTVRRLAGCSDAGGIVPLTHSE